MQRWHSRFLSCRLGVKSDLLHRNHDWSDLNGSLTEMHLQQNDVNDSNVWRSQVVAYLSFLDAFHLALAQSILLTSLSIPEIMSRTYLKMNKISLIILVKSLTPDDAIIKQAKHHCHLYHFNLKNQATPVEQMTG